MSRERFLDFDPYIAACLTRDKVELINTIRVVEQRTEPLAGWCRVAVHFDGHTIESARMSRKDAEDVRFKVMDMVEDFLG